MLDLDEQFRTNYESAGFLRPVSVGMYYRTSEDDNDGFGNPTASCREYTLLRAHRDSVVKLWIQKRTEFGPLLDVKTFCQLDKHGIEIQIPSASGDTNVWVVICRGPNRYKDQESSFERLEEADFGKEQGVPCKTTDCSIEISMPFI